MSRRKIRESPTWELTKETFVEYGYKVPEKLPRFGMVEMAILIDDKVKMATVLHLLSEGKGKGDPEWDAVFRVDQTM